MKIYLFTSNGYTHIVPTTLALFDKYWPNQEIVVLGYEEVRVLDHYNLASSVKTVCLGNQDDYGKAWSTGLVNFFEELKDRYFIVSCEDCAPMRAVDLEKMALMEERMKSGFADKAVLGGGVPLDETTQIDDHTLLFNQNLSYRTSIIPAIWTKEYFLRYLKPGMSIHDFEANPSIWKAANDGANIINYNTGPSPENPHLFCVLNIYRHGRLTVQSDLTFACHMPQERWYSKEDLQFVYESITENKSKFEAFRIQA